MNQPAKPLLERITAHLNGADETFRIWGLENRDVAYWLLREAESAVARSPHDGDVVARTALERLEWVEGRAAGALKWLFSHHPLNVRHAKDVLLIGLHTTEEEFTDRYQKEIIPAPTDANRTAQDTICILARYILQNSNDRRLRDHGCPQCMPEGGDLVKPDFVCAYHLAEAYVQTRAAEAEESVPNELADACAKRLSCFLPKDHEGDCDDSLHV